MICRPSGAITNFRLYLFSDRHRPVPFGVETTPERQTCGTARLVATIRKARRFTGGRGKAAKRYRENGADGQHLENGGDCLSFPNGFRRFARPTRQASLAIMALLLVVIG